MSKLRIVVVMIWLLVPAVCLFSEETPETILQRGLYFSDLYNWTAARPYLVEAKHFALFHQPADLAHWVSFVVTGIAYGWIRVASRSTTAAAVMHATYNLAVFLSAIF
jgi:membrane protease YdiL (CAAX protease family)